MKSRSEVDIVLNRLKEAYENEFGSDITKEKIMEFTGELLERKHKAFLAQRLDHLDPKDIIELRHQLSSPYQPPKPKPKPKVEVEVKPEVKKDAEQTKPVKASSKAKAKKQKGKAKSKTKTKAVGSRQKASSSES